MRTAPRKTRISVVSFLGGEVPCCPSLFLAQFMRAQGGMLIRLRLKAARKSIRSSSTEESLSWLEPIQELGFTIVPGVLEATDIDGLLEELSRADLPRSRAGVRHAMRLPAVAAIAQEARMMGIARENLGRDAFPFRATLFDKSPAANWLVVWHQDTALPLLSTRVTAVECLVPQGGVLAMRPLIVHASSKSQSEAPRRVLHIEYAASLGAGDGLELAIA